MAHHLSIGCCFKISCSNIHRSVNTRFEVGSWFRPMMMFHENIWRRTMMECMTKFSCNGYTGQQCSAYLCPKTNSITTAFHIHFRNHLREERHAVVVIYIHEFIKLFLCYLMAYDLSVNNCGHFVFAFCLGMFFCFSLFSFFGGIE